MLQTYWFLTHDFLVFLHRLAGTCDWFSGTSNGKCRWIVFKNKFHWPFQITLNFDFCVVPLSLASYSMFFKNSHLKLMCHFPQKKFVQQTNVYCQCRKVYVRRLYTGGGTAQGSLEALRRDIWSLSLSVKFADALLAFSRRSFGFHLYNDVIFQLGSKSIVKNCNPNNIIMSHTVCIICWLVTGIRVHRRVVETRHATHKETVKRAATLTRPQPGWSIFCPAFTFQFHHVCMVLAILN